MFTRPSLLICALLASALLAAGCGGSDDKSGSTASTATATTDTQVANDPRVKAAIQRCKDTIEKNPQINAEIKQQFQAICDKAAGGNAEDVKKALREVCEKIVNDATSDEKVRAQGRKACAQASG